MARLDKITSGFLDEQKALYPEAWALVTAVAFTASSFPEAVPLVFLHALSDLKNEPIEKQQLLVRTLREAIFKSSQIVGLPRVMNSLISLYEATPDELREKTYVRDPKETTEVLTKNGQEAFNKTYGDTAEATQEKFKNIYPDFEYYSIMVAYGIVYGVEKVFPLKENSYAIISSLIPSDMPTQTAWHLQGAINNGATYKQVVAVRQISINVTDASDIVLKNPVPEVPPQTSA